MPGPVSDSYDPEFGTGANAHDVASATREVVDIIGDLLGPELMDIVVLARDDKTNWNKHELVLDERQLRIIRFNLLRSLETI